MKQNDAEERSEGTPSNNSLSLLWLGSTFLLLIAAGAVVLGTNIFGKDSPTVQKPSITHESPVTATDEIDGAPIYANRCATCHQADGKGIPKIFPPLASSAWVTGNPDHVIRIVLNGLNGPIEVAGETYQGVMPGLSILADEEISAVVNYVRSNFGNNASPVTSVDVARIRAEGRKTLWTAEELAAIQ